MRTASLDKVLAFGTRPVMLLPGGLTDLVGPQYWYELPHAVVTELGLTTDCRALCKLVSAPCRPGKTPKRCRSELVTLVPFSLSLSLRPWVPFFSWQLLIFCEWGRELQGPPRRLSKSLRGSLVTK